MKKPTRKLPAPKPQPMNSMAEAPVDVRLYKAREAMHDIARAESHKKDRSLMRDVRKLAKSTMKACS
jgi:hypothetical protein